MIVKAMYQDGRAGIGSVRHVSQHTHTQLWDAAPTGHRTYRWPNLGYFWRGSGLGRSGPDV